tara:strand:- start:48123 stop:49067 length:945 start_codon:yes stop_codon:yes gene_type:complete
MSWRDLLQEEDERVVAPWTGGRSLRLGPRKWKIRGRLPEEPGFYSWEVSGRVASDPQEADAIEAVENADAKTQLGYLVGDFFVSDLEGGECSLERLGDRFERVRLIEPGLDFFDRVEVCRLVDGGPLYYVQQAFPLGPEGEVTEAFESQEDSLNSISGVAPALDLAFRARTWYRAQQERLREEARLRREAEERRREEEARIASIRESLGDGAGRRQMAALDFEEAARAALAVGGASLLSIRAGRSRNEHVVRYQLDDGRRFECVCDSMMSILEAGVCLTDERTGEKGDTLFTLESLPVVVRDAMNNGAVIFRHV